jgi:hypothetical protein
MTFNSRARRPARSQKDILAMTNEHGHLSNVLDDLRSTAKSLVTASTAQRSNGDGDPNSDDNARLQTAAGAMTVCAVFDDVAHNTQMNADNALLLLAKLRGVNRASQVRVTVEQT